MTRRHFDRTTNATSANDWKRIADNWKRIADNWKRIADDWKRIADYVSDMDK